MMENEQDELTAMMNRYRYLMQSLSIDTANELIGFPSDILDLVSDYTHHGDINVFLMEVHSKLFAIAYNNPEDFQTVANWWMSNGHKFNALIVEP